MFDCFVSLGSHCPVASSMGKYGLRSFSGPFDWLVTGEFSWVLHYLETDFRDFLLRENLERFNKFLNPDHFRDIQSNIIFLHDTENFEHDYEALKDKYDRRIGRFLKEAKGRVCYLRSLETTQGVEYVVHNAEYIQKIIKKNNPDSEIVFLCNRGLVRGSFPFRCFNMPEIWHFDSENAMRSYFDHADDFLTFCGENYPALRLIKNLEFDSEKKYDRLIERRYKTLTTLLAHDFSGDIDSDKTIIYGAGAIGKELYKKIKNLTSVICFIDREKAGIDFEGIPIVWTDHVKYEEGVKVIVSAAYDFQSIKASLADKFQEQDIVSLDDLLHLEF